MVFFPAEENFVRGTEGIDRTKPKSVKSAGKSTSRLRAPHVLEISGAGAANKKFIYE
jgi:hypothetical protein